MKQLNYGYSDDYAVINSGKYQFYYGYEHTTDNDEWCFVVRENGKIIKEISTSEIEKHFNSIRLDSPSNYLNCGIAIFLLTL